jgi:hypothetical protein
MNCAKYLRVPLLALVAAAVIAIPASASTLAWNVTATDLWAGSNQGDFADVFTANENITLTQIGIPVPPNNVNSGLYSSTVNVGLYDSLGNPLAGANLDPVSASGGYYWANVGPVALVSGMSYTVVVDNNGSVPAYAYSATGPTSVWATFDSSEFLSSNVTYSTIDPGAGNTVSGNFYDINMQGSPTATPEPESLLLLGSGLIGLAGLARFKLRKQ